MKITANNSVDEFALSFLKSRFIWRNIPRLDNIRNFGSIISMVLYKETPFQVELLIVPHKQSSFTTHRHPDVDTVEYGLSGNHVFILNGKPGYTQQQMDNWLIGEYDTPAIHIAPTDWHSGHNSTMYSFLSIQKWLNGVEPTSVGLNWEGELVSKEHEALLGINKEDVDKLHVNKQDTDYDNFSIKLHAISDQAKWRMTL